MSHAKCDLRQRVNTDPRIGSFLAELKARLGVSDNRAKRYRYSQIEERAPTISISLSQAQFIVRMRDDEALRFMINSPRIRIENWPKSVTNLFWWQAAQVALQPGTIWSLTLDEYARVHGWPEQKSIKALNKSEVMYDTRRPKEILKALEPWAQNISEAEFLQIVAEPKSSIANVVVRQAKNPGVDGVLALSLELVREFVKHNEYLAETGDIIWPKLIALLKEEREGERSNIRTSGVAFHGQDNPVTAKRKEIQKITKTLADRGIAPNPEAKEMLWEWGIERQVDAFSPLGNQDFGLTGKQWAEKTARQILLHPETGLSSKELDALWAAAPSWPVALSLAWHPALKVSTAERVAQTVGASGWRNGPVFGVSQDLGKGFLIGLANAGLLRQSALLRDFAIRRAQMTEMGVIIKALDPKDQEPAVKSWLMREPVETLMWLMRAPRADKAHLTPRVLSGVMINPDKNMRIMAAQVLGTFESPSKTSPENRDSIPEPSSETLVKPARRW